MKGCSASLLLLACAAALASAAGAAEDEALFVGDSIRAFYFSGIQNNDIGLLRKIFHYDCRLFQPLGEEDVVCIDQEAFLDSLDTEGAEEKWAFDILSVDVTGHTAAAKVTLENMGEKRTEYLGLLKIKDEWWIMSRITYIERK